MSETFSPYLSFLGKDTIMLFFCFLGFFFVVFFFSFFSLIILPMKILAKGFFKKLVQSASLEFFKAHLDEALNNLV